MKLTFERSYKNGTKEPIVLPFVQIEDKAIEIEDVVACSIDCGVDKLTQMTLIVNVREDNAKPNET